MNKPVYDNYWQKKEARKNLKDKKPDKKDIFNKIMKMFFHREEPEKEYAGHKRSPKQRHIRRIRHQSMMRNHGG